MINLLMLMMSVPAIDYVETFKPGDLLDINQGYYVCEYPGDEALKRLMAIKNDVLRRKEAKELKCEFRDKKASEPYQIKSLDQSICLDPTSSFEYTHDDVRTRRSSDDHYPWRIHQVCDLDQHGC